MKTVLTFIISLSFALNSYAQGAPLPSEAEAYWQWSQNQSQDPESVDQCLEKIYGASQDLPICMTAITDLTQATLNSHRREILVSLLQKIPTTQLTRQQSELLKGLLLTHPELNSETLPAKKSSILIPGLEVKAWLKALSKKADLNEVMMSLNGQPLTLVDHACFPQGTYQWTLLVPGMEPLLVVGTWNDFSTQLGSLRTRAETKNLLPTSAQTPPAEQLGDLSFPSEESTSQATTTSHTWIWVTLIAVGTGVAAAMALQNKNVSVAMPGQN